MGGAEGVAVLKRGCASCCHATHGSETEGAFALVAVKALSPCLCDGLRPRSKTLAGSSGNGCNSSSSNSSGGGGGDGAVGGGGRNIVAFHIPWGGPKVARSTPLGHLPPSLVRIKAGY
ncbi:hypothetical protein V1477_018904 [Vespula maculifrons]|uniref:Uncharacterized protein n=1 Tax=Vespula maculifrons TaxID=7453 RepID=A0ABD2ASS4_VESMC